MFARLDRVFIISELHPQHEGNMETLKTMILQSKFAGADAIKLQLYNSEKLLGNNSKQFAEISFDELAEIKNYSDIISIDVFASCFDEEKIDWCERLDFKYHKVASKMHSNSKLCEKIINCKKPTLISNGISPSFEYGVHSNVKYLYCVSQYPTLLEDIHLPDFKNHPWYIGYSDHTFGISACKVAVSRGAKIIEKHFTLSKSLQSTTTKAHLGAMTVDELVELRKFCDDYSAIGDFCD